MEKDSRSWFHHQNPNQQSSTRNFFGSPINMGFCNPVTAYKSPYSTKDSTTGTLFPLQNLKASELNDSPDWLYCLSRLRQAFASTENSGSKGQFPVGPLENLGQKGLSDNFAANIQKKFLVFDQSGEKTSLLYSSGAKTPVQCLTSWSPKPPTTCNLITEERRNTTSPPGSILKDECTEYNYGDDLESELHEDTEELNALLYSDSDCDCSEDDEDTTSTGHSPSTMTDIGLQEMFEEWVDGGSNSASPMKRQKLLDLGFGVPSQVNSSGSLQTHRFSELEDDAESSCGNSSNQDSKRICSLSGKKRARKGRIRETVSILRSIIPGGKGKNATVVIDEAIDYLRSLKVKAKNLGLDTF